MLVRYSYYNRKYIHPGETINVSKELNNMGRENALVAERDVDWNGKNIRYWIGWNKKEGLTFNGSTVFYGNGTFGHWLEYRVAITDEDKEPDDTWEWKRWEIS